MLVWFDDDDAHGRERFWYNIFASKGKVVFLADFRKNFVLY